MATAWEIIDTISPVFSDRGAKNWDLCLAKNGIIMVPQGLWLTIRAGILAGLGSPGGMQRSRTPEAAVMGARMLEDDGSETWRRYPLEEIESIVLQRRWFSASEVRIRRRGQEEHVYGAGDFREIMRSREVLRRLYPALYAEQGRWP